MLVKGPGTVVDVLRMHSLTAPARRSTSDTARRLRRVAVVLGMMTWMLAGHAPSASAAPAPDTANVTRSTVGALPAGVIPDGVCQVRATVAGGGGGSSPVLSGNGGIGGAGAVISATFDVVPGQTYDGIVGGGGTITTAGASAGTVGVGGTSGTVAQSHRGGSGGGRSTFSLAGSTMIVAGGGGGAGAAHDAAPAGFGGGAGFSGIAPGVAAVGNNGSDGVDPGTTATGGQGGQPTVGGAGGSNAGAPGANGLTGGGLGVGSGGNGGVDLTSDSAGGGGGGYTGGGGGASTISSSRSAAGGGGGSSYVAAASPTAAAAAPTNVTGSAGPASPAASGPGAVGSITLDFIPCQYELAITKKVSAPSVNAGGKVVWTIAVTNNGPAAMTKGDTIDLSDTLPVGPNGNVSPAFKVTNIASTGGSNADLSSGPITCTGVVVGSAMPASTNCSRAYDAPNAVGTPTGGLRGLDVGETVTISYEQVISNTAPCQTITNTATVKDRSSLTAGTDQIGVVADKTSNAALIINCYDLIVTQSPPPATVFPSGTITWSVTITNAGPADMSGPVDTTPNPLQVGATFPAGIGAPAMVSSNGPAGACTLVGAQINCPNSLPAGTSHTLTFTQSVPGTTPANTVLGTNFTVVDPKTGDTNDAAASSVTVILPALPVAGNDAGNGTAGQPFNGPNVLTNDSGTGIKVTSFTQPTNGTVTFNPDGSYTYIPVDGFSGTQTFTYTLTDVFGRSVVGTINLKIYPATNPDSAATIVATETIGTSLVGNDIGTALKVVSNTNPVHGTIVINADSTYTYLPVPGYSGPDSFTYTVSDASGLTATETVTLLVTPLAPNDSATTTANNAVTGVSVLNNDSGTGLVVDGYTQPSNGTVVMQPTGEYLYTPNKGFSGVDTFSYTAIDTNGKSATAVVMITVVPTAANDTGATLADTQLNGLSVVKNDIGTGLYVSDFGQPSHGSVSVANTGGYVYVPNSGFSGTDSFPYTVTDAAGNTATSVVSISVSPRATDDSGSTSAGVTLVGPSVLTNDSGITLAASSGTAPGHGNVTINPDGTYTYTPTDGYSGADSFTYTVTDAAGLSSTGTVTVMIKPVAASNVAVTTSNTQYQGLSVLLNALGYGLSISSNTQPAHGSAVVHPDGTYVYTPAPGYSGTDSFTYTIIDAAGQTVVQHVDIQVNPLVVSDDGTTFMSTTLDGATVLSNDVGTGLRIVGNTQPTNGTVALLANGTYVYVPTARYIGQDSFTYTVQDANGVRATTVVNIQVLPPQLAPAATPDRHSTGYGTPYNGSSVLANDRGVEIRLSTWSLPSHGTLTMNPDGTFVYVPNEGFSGADFFAYTIVDIAGRASSTGVVIEVGVPTPQVVFDTPVPMDPMPSPAAPPAPSASPTPAPSPSATGGTVHGKVTASDGTPVSGVRLILTCDGTEIGTTTSTPDFTLVGVPVGASCSIVVDESSLPPDLRDHLPITTPTFVVVATGDTVVDVVVAPTVRSATAPPEPQLALTGSSSTPLAMLALLLVVMGVVMMRFGRRRELDFVNPARAAHPDLPRTRLR